MSRMIQRADWALVVLILGVVVLFTGACVNEARQPAQWPVVKVPAVVKKSPEELRAAREAGERARAEREERDRLAEEQRLAAMPKVSGEYLGNDIRDVLADFAGQTGTPIICDWTVQGEVTLVVNNIPLESAMDMVLFGGGFEFRQLGLTYFVGSIDANNPASLRLLETETVSTSYPAEDVIARISNLFGKYLSTAGDTSHSITISAPPRLLKLIKGEIAKIDARRRQILVDVLVIDVSFEKGFQVGQNLGDIQLTGDGVIDLARGVKTGYSGTIMASILSTVQFLWKNGAVDLKANPKVITLEGKEAVIDVTLEQRFAILSGNVSFPQIFIEVVKTGTVLKVTPWMLDDERVLLELEPEVSDVVGQTRQSSQSGGEQILPVVSRRSVKSSVKVRFGETVIIGGMRNTLIREESSHVPGLGNLPIVNFAFANQKKQHDTKEVLILVTPRWADEEGIAESDFSSETYRSAPSR